MISFRVSNVGEFVQAYQEVFAKTQMPDQKMRDLCCMEVGEGKVYFYRFDGGVYTESWCDAHITEGGKVVVSQKGFEPLTFCQGAMSMVVDKKITIEHSRGTTKVNRDDSVNPDIFHKAFPTQLFTKFPVDPRSLLWTEGEFLKIGGKYMETNVQTIKASYYIHESPIMDKIAYLPTDKANLLKEDSLFCCDTGLIWIRNGNTLHRISGKSDVFQDEKKVFLAPYFQEFPLIASISMKASDFREGMAYARALTIDPEIHYGRCSIRYNGGEKLFIENLVSERMIQDSTDIPLSEGDRLGEFDITVIPGDMVNCIDALRSEEIKLQLVAKSIRIVGGSGVCGAVAVYGDEWRKRNGK